LRKKLEQAISDRNAAYAKELAHQKGKRKKKKKKRNK